jgi:hypothetical protein
MFARKQLSGNDLRQITVVQDGHILVMLRFSGIDGMGAIHREIR